MASPSPASNLPAPARFAVFDGDLDADWAALYAGARALAVDTEAMGLIHGRDRLCLVQLSAGDGEVRVIGPGEVLLVEDTTGKGHITKIIDGAMRRSIFVALD